MNYTITQGTRQGACEVYFDGKPTEQTRNAMKGAKMRWNSGKCCWYGFITADTLKALIEGTGELTSVSGLTAPKAEQVASVPLIKFYWNGIKVNGGNLIKCFYSVNENNATIYARDYNHLPTAYWQVDNDTDIYTDYFDSDSATIDKTHPLYKMVVSAANAAQAHFLKAQIEHDKKQIEKYKACGNTRYIESYKKSIEKYTEQLQAIKDTTIIQPTNSDLLKIDAMKEQAENERRKKEQEEEQARKEKYLSEKVNGKRLVEKCMEEYPLITGDPYKGA